METLLTDDFHLKAENIIFMGSLGVKKTHLSISIVMEVACKRNTVYFIKFSKLIMNLKDAYNEGSLERKTKV